MTRSEIWRIEKYLRNLFRLDTITVIERPQADSVEVHVGGEFTGPHTSQIALRVPDVHEARRELEAKGVEFGGDTLDTGVCHMAFFRDPDGNALMLHRRYAPND